MLPPCPKRFNRDNDWCCPITLLDFILVAGIAKNLDFGIVTSSIFGIAGAFLFGILSSY